jgi:AbrB family looped-hinge helix DNA binding protein
MLYQVTVTSQGQITIPAELRRKLNLNNSRLLIRQVDNTIVMEPAPDVLTQFGVLQDKAITGKKIEEVIALEEEILTDVVSEKYKP